VDSVRKKHLI